MEVIDVKYKEEATELIEGMEKSLLAMEDNFDNPGLIEDVFRNMHTLKGNSSMFGFKLVADFTHHFESIYDLIRSGEMKISKEILNVSFAALDHLSSLVNNGQTLNEKEKQSHANLSKKVIEIISQSGNKQADIDTGGNLQEKIISHETGRNTWQIFFQPAENFFLNGSNPLTIINELHQLGECKVIAKTDEIPSLEKCDFDKCYMSWEILLTTTKDLQSIRDLFKFVQHKSKLEIHEVSPGNSSADSEVPYSEITVTGDAHAFNSVESPLSHGTENHNAVNKKNVISSIRVPSLRLDNLMNLVSELMTLQAKLGTLAEYSPNAELLSVSENLEKISTRLRDNAFSMCLLPIENMVTPLQRLVRDLALGLNKEIQFITDGTETELDKNIMEGLSDPLMHIIRNSIDHGIEEPEARLKLGKPRHGKILLNAYCAGTNVYIEIQDDGKGIDPEKIKKKAIAKGIIGPEENLSNKEILSLVFLPGFSTAEQVSEISGRGVGMDVVKRRISDIRGQIKIHSEVNVGTTISIKLPITVSVIDGLLVKINDADFVIPLSAVERCHEIPVGHQLNRFTNIIVLDGEQIPFISLTEEFDDIENFASSKEIVVIYYDERKVGLIVDQVVGKFQAVLKPLGKYFLKMDNISGATILGNGKIALVLDTNNLTEQFLNKKSVYSFK